VLTYFKKTHSSNKLQACITDDSHNPSSRRECRCSVTITFETETNIQWVSTYPKPATFLSLTARTSSHFPTLQRLGRASTIITIPDHSRELIFFGTLAVRASWLCLMSALLFYTCPPRLLAFVVCGGMWWYMVILP